MFTIALIGVDGAGKTTIAKMLIKSLPIRVKYLYMGTNVRMNKYALPTSRFIFWLKYRLVRKKYKHMQQQENTSKLDLEHRPDKRGKLGAALRLLNRIAEDWHKQFVSWSFQLFKYNILYDRHPVFDFAPSGVAKRATDRIHYWELRHIYPKPDLVFFLDAPPEVLLNRKDEGTLEYLERRRKAILRQRGNFKHFIRIDVTQNIDNVHKEVKHHIIGFINEEVMHKTQNLKGQ